MYYSVSNLDLENIVVLDHLMPSMPLGNIEQERWLDFGAGGMEDSCSFYWMRTYEDYGSLVFMPSVYVSEYNSRATSYYVDENKIHLHTKNWGIKIITGYGHRLMIDEALWEKRFAYPTKQELEIYYDAIRCPIRHEKPIHRFLRKAMKMFR